MIKPGGTIGILGGGQLGRMLAISAAQLGYRVIAYAPAGDAVIAQVCNEYIAADWHDAEALKAFADACDVVTLEFENVSRTFETEAPPNDGQRNWRFIYSSIDLCCCILFMFEIFLGCILDYCYY